MEPVNESEFNQEEFGHLENKLQAVMGSQYLLAECTFTEFCLLQELLNVEMENQRITAELTQVNKQNQWDAEIWERRQAWRTLFQDSQVALN